MCISLIHPELSSDRFLINEGCFLSRWWTDDSADDNLKGLFKAKCAFCSLSMSLHLCWADTGTISSCHLLSTYLKIIIWHEINEMNAVIRLHAWGWKNQFPVSAVTQLLLLWRLLWWLFLRLYRVCVRECVCAFSCCHFLCVSQSWWFSAAPWATREGEKVRKRKKKKTLGFQIESQVSRRDLSAICEYQKVQPFAVRPAAINDTSLNTGCQQMMNPSKWWTDFAMQWKKAQREHCGGKVLVLSALKQTQQCQTPAWLSALRGFFYSGLFRPQRFCPLKAACTDVEERLLLHDKISPSKFDLRLPGQSTLTFFSFHSFFAFFKDLIFSFAKGNLSKQMQYDANVG